MKNYIVTGGLGHIGSHVVDELIKRGHKVLVIDDLSTGSLANRNPKAELLKTSILKVLNAPALAKTKWDTVIHLAAFGNVRAGGDDPAKAQKRGANLTLAMLEVCRKHNIPKFVFVSSVVVKFNPHIPYGIEKFAAERYCIYYQKRFGLDVSIIRLNNVYGSPRHTTVTGNVIPAFVKQKKENGKIQISGDGSQVRDFIYYTDAVTAILQAEKKKGITEAGSTQGRTILEVARIFNCPIEFIGKPHGEVDLQLCERSDYKIKVPFKMGMKRLLSKLPK